MDQPHIIYSLLWLSPVVSIILPCSHTGLVHGRPSEVIIHLNMIPQVPVCHHCGIWQTKYKSTPNNPEYTMGGPKASPHATAAKAAQGLHSQGVMLFGSPHLCHSKIYSSRRSEALPGLPFLRESHSLVVCKCADPKWVMYFYQWHWKLRLGLWTPASLSSSLTLF